MTHQKQQNWWCFAAVDILAICCNIVITIFYVCCFRCVIELL